MKENILEKLLLSSSKDDSLYLEFIIFLLCRKIYAPVTDRKKNSMYVWKSSGNKKFIPFFTSLSILEQVCTATLGGKNNYYVEMQGRDFFEIIDMPAILNPNSDCMKEFTIGEIGWLRDQYISPWVFLVEPESNIIFFHPAKYPENSLNSLSKIFNTYPEVKFASFCKCDLFGEEMKEFNLIGLEVDGDFKYFFKKMENDLNKIKEDIRDFSFVNLKEGGVITKELKITEPFYKRKI